MIKKIAELEESDFWKDINKNAQQEKVKNLGLWIYICLRNISAYTP